MKEHECYWRREAEELTKERDVLAEAIQHIKDAILNEGNNPSHHHMILSRHTKEWPILWNAIDHALEITK